MKKNIDLQNSKEAFKEELQEVYTERVSKRNAKPKKVSTSIKGKLTLSNLIRYHRVNLEKVILSGLTPAEIIISMSIDATEEQLIACIKRNGMGEFLAKEDKRKRTVRKLNKQKGEIEVAIDQFIKKASVKRKTQNAETLVTEKKWEVSKREIRERFATLQGFCDHYSFTEEDFEDVFSMQKSEKAERVLNALLKEELIKKSDILKYWNAVSPNIDHKIGVFKSVLSESWAGKPAKVTKERKNAKRKAG